MKFFPFLYDFKIPKYLSIISLTAFIWQIFIHRRIQLFWCREFTLITAFTMIIISGIFFAIDRRLALESFLDIYSKIIVMTFAVAILIQRPQQLALTLKAIIISGLIVAITAIYNRIKGIGLVEGTRTTIGRDLGSMLGDPNDLALVLMFPISFSIALLLTHQVSWHISFIWINRNDYFILCRNLYSKPRGSTWYYCCLWHLRVATSKIKNTAY